MGHVKTKPDRWVERSPKMKNLYRCHCLKKFACGIFICIKKALDTASYDILLEKRNHYGIRGISNDGLRSYLSDRTQFVSINSFNSDYKTVKYGAPQDSVLVLLLFLNFINDFNISIKKPRNISFC